MSKPEAPNYQPVAQASAENAAIMRGVANDDRAWSMEQWNQQRALMEPVIQDQLTDSAFQRDLARAQMDQGIATQEQYLGMLEQYNSDQSGLMGAQTAQMQQNQAQGADYYQNFVDTYRPVEQRVVDEAMAFNTAARQDEMARAYQAQHQTALAQQRSATERAAASRGINPNSGAALALERQGDTTAAAQLAAGMNATRQAARAEGQGRLMEAVGIGRNQPGYSTNAYQLATGASNAATSQGQLGLSAIGTGLSTGQAMIGQGFQGLQGATSSAASPFSWMNANNAGAMTGLSNGTQAMYQGGALQMQGLGSILDSQTSVYGQQLQANSAMTGAVLGGVAGLGGNWMEFMT